MIKKIITFIFTTLMASSLNAQWLQTNGPEGGKIGSIVADSNAIYTGTNSGIYKSTNAGSTWVNITSGINFTYSNESITAITTTKNYVFAGTSNSGIFYSSNQGLTWNTPGVLNSSEIRALSANGDTLIAATPNYLFLSTDLGSNWIDITNGLVASNITSALLIGSSIFVATDGGGLFFSSNFGSTWSSINAGLTSLTIYSIHANGANIYACSDNGVFSSNNNGTSWSLISTGLSGYFNGVTFSGSKIVICGSSGVFISSNNGTSWTTINPVVFNLFPQCLLSWQGNLFLGLDGNGIYSSQNEGVSWAEKNTGLFSSEVFSITGNSTDIYAGVPTGGVFHSTTNGTNWVKANTGLSSLVINKVVLNGSKLYACTTNGLYTSVNGGNNWNPINLIGQSNITSIAFNGSNIYCCSASGSGVYYSNNNGLSWVTINNGLGNNDILSIGVIGNTLYAGTTSNGIYVSTNNGANWAAANSGLLGTSIYTLEPSGNGMLAGTGYGLFFSANSGSTWMQLFNAGYSIASICVSGGNIFIADMNKVYLSQNNGTTWTPVDTGLPVNSLVRSLCIAGNFIYAGTNGGVWIRPLFQLLGTSLIPQVDSIQGTTCYGGQDGSASVSVSGGTAPYTFSWTPSGGNAASASGLAAGMYIVYIEDSLNAQTLASVFIPQPAALTGTLSVLPSSCIVNDGSASISPLGGTPPYSYLWNSSDTTSSVVGLAPGQYSVTLSDANACSTTIPLTIATISYPNTAPNICLTTVDSLSLHNVIIWEKDSLITYIDSFRIYRLDASSYNYIASVGYHQLSQYTDIDPTVDPQANIRRYKLATVDQCGYVSNLSDYHTTILLTDFQNGVFQYTPYDIQNQASTLVQQYLLQRLDSATGNWNTISSNPGAVSGVIVAPNYSLYSFSSYRVIADLGTYSCEATARMQTGFSVTRSNIKNKTLTVRNPSYFDAQVVLQPNPASNQILIKHTVALEEIKVYDSMGQNVIQQATAKPTSGNIYLDISKLSSGMYTVNCKGKDFEVRKKLVVNN